MMEVAALVGRAMIVPVVDPDRQTVEVAGAVIRLNCCQFETFLALRPLTPVNAIELAELLHLRHSRTSKSTARMRVKVLRQSLKAATGRDDLIETTIFGYRLVAS